MSTQISGFNNTAAGPALKVALLSYPMLFQSIGGLQVQVLETLAALQRLGCDARLVDPARDKLSEFDLIHVFSVINGNHRMVEWAHSHRKPVVLSPLLRPNWTRPFARRAALGEWLVARLTRWELKSEYRQMHSAITRATRLVALGPVERQCLHDAFRVPLSSTSVVPNGIPQRFFEADPAPFLQAHGLRKGFVLCVASINSHKNQLGLAKALAASDIPLVIVGPCTPANQNYLAEIKRHPHVHYAGSLAYDSPLLPSAYAAAGVFCLPSMSEVMPLSVLEALAAGCPAVMTQHHCMDVSGMESVLAQVDPNSAADIHGAVNRLLRQPPSKADCQEAVRHLTWEAVADQLLQIYRRATM